jgi:hypothetical protein
VTRNKPAARTKLASADRKVPASRKAPAKKPAPSVPVPGPEFGGLLASLREVIQTGRQQAVRAIDVVQVRTYWTVGRHIVEFEQGGAARAAYGARLLADLAEHLTAKFGKGFDASNMRLFYQVFPNCDALRHELRWARYASKRRPILSPLPRELRDDIAPKVAADRAYQNAKENTPHTARMAHDQALGKVMQILLKDDTQVYKQFVENESFRRFVGDMVYALTSQ